MIINFLENFLGKLNPKLEIKRTLPLIDGLLWIMRVVFL